MILRSRSSWVAVSSSYNWAVWITIVLLGLNEPMVVTLSEAKSLGTMGGMLRSAQHDKPLGYFRRDVLGHEENLEILGAFVSWWLIGHPFRQALRRRCSPVAPERITPSSASGRSGSAARLR